MDVLLSLSYWIHLAATVVWLGGLTTMALVAWPAWRARTLNANQWLTLQQRLLPWANGSMVVLWVTGFIQMTNDSHYQGFLVLDSAWAWAILLKHLAVLGMMVIGLYVGWRIHPAMQRLQLLAERQPQALSALDEQVRQEQRLLRLNLGCAALVLLLTAVATAVP